MTKAIVTVKLDKNPEHDPHNKKVGVCPCSNEVCTDVTGQHHSFLMEEESFAIMEEKAIKKWGHVTRIEVIGR